MDLTPASTPVHFRVARDLFRDYAHELSEDLCFQNFEQELAHIDEIYAPPQGVALLAGRDEDFVGCVAVRALEYPTVCEMKRMYVAPRARGLGLGRKLAQAALEEARRLNYQVMRLDTLGRLQAALYLYRELGFYEIEPYYDNPLAQVVYLEKRLVKFEQGKT